MNKSIMAKKILAVLLSVIILAVSGVMSIGAAADGQNSKNGWVTENNISYFYVGGVAVTGWNSIDNKAYYFNDKGQFIRQAVPGVSKFTGENFQKMLGDLYAGLWVNSAVRYLAVTDIDAARKIANDNKSVLGDIDKVGIVLVPAEYSWEQMEDARKIMYAKFPNSFTESYTRVQENRMRFVTYKLTPEMLKAKQDMQYGGCIVFDVSSHKDAVVVPD